MPITMEARDNGHILYVKMTDPVDLRDLETAFKTEQNYRDGSAYTMHTIVDITNMKIYPRASLIVGRRSPALMHPRRGHLAMVGATTILQALVEAMQRLTRVSNVRFFKAEEAAMTYLRNAVAEEMKDGLAETPTPDTVV